MKSMTCGTRIENAGIALAIVTCSACWACGKSSESASARDDASRSLPSLSRSDDVQRFRGRVKDTLAGARTDVEQTSPEIAVQPAVAKLKADLAALEREIAAGKISP